MSLAPPALGQTPQPVARITSPVRDQTLRGSVQIQGTATSPNFSRYEVSFAAEPGLQTWTVIGGGTQPVAAGFLASWNTRPLPDGAYALRVQVFGADGRVTDMPTPVRNLAALNGGASASAGVTGTGVLTSSQGADAPLPAGGADDEGFDLAAIPRAVGRGAQIALYGFAALAAYLVLKRMLGLIIRRILPRRVDYGD